MASNLMAFSGVSAKLAAMSRNLLKKEDYEALMMETSVPGVAIYLQKTPMYSEALKGVEIEQLHRRDIEIILKADYIKDIEKFVTFMVTLDKSIVKCLFMRHEIENLKLAIRNALIEVEAKKTVQYLESKFYNLGNRALIDPIKVALSSGREEILNNLEDSPYYGVIRNVFVSHMEPDMNVIGVIENALDKWFLPKFLESMKKMGPKNYIIGKRMIGQRVDLINLEWIVRVKKFYTLRPEEIYNSIIPVYFRLNTEYLRQLCEARDVKECLNMIMKGPYGEDFESLSDDEELPHRITERVRRLVYREAKRSLLVFGSFSIASFFHYFYLKEYEIMDIISIIEGVRYKIKPDEIKNYLIRTF